VPGVHAVLTARRRPGREAYGLEHADQPVLASDEVRYQGEPVALVAADHPETARRAAERDPRRLRGAARSSDPERAPMALTRRRCTPAATWCATTKLAAATRRPDGAGRRQRRLRGRHAGPGLPRPGVRARRAGRGRRRRPLRRHPVAARRPATGRACARPAAREGAADTWPASAARSAAARTSRCRSTPACSRCTPAGR
jgi:hypothetical protein